jgi:2-amino-4-hydroxy-6-hydroxymethyldihydropteridine diphosphokinase
VNKVTLLLGTNLGDKFRNLAEAKKKISSEIGQILMQSSVYESEPWGFSHPENFLNMVVTVDSELSALEILTKIKFIEKKLGRNGKSKIYEARIIDIDILYFNNEIINYPELTIPHPQMHNRKFTLLPLDEILPQRIHPLLKKTSSVLLLECKDQSFVKKL